MSATRRFAMGASFATPILGTLLVAARHDVTASGQDRN
jgi:hypothetical protein